MDARADTLRRLALAAAFAALLVAAFPFRSGEFTLDLGRVAGWLALVPFALLVRDLPARRAFAWGAGAATLGLSGVLFWIYVVVVEHGAAAAPVGVLIVLALAGALGLGAGGAGALCAWLGPRMGAADFLVLPSAWVVLEYLRGVMPFGGLPWALLGYSAHANGPVRELAALGGVYGLSFVMALFAALAVRRRWLPALGVLVAAHATGFLLGVSGMASGAGAASAHRVGIVQGNIAQSLKWDPVHADESFEVHLETSRLAAAAAPVDLIVWPEAAATVPLTGRYRAALAELARETGATLLIGGVAIEAAFPGARQLSDYRFFNSVFVVMPDGGFADRYDKSRLVPFGEYLPLRPLLGLFVDALASGRAGLADITPGAGPRTVEVPGYGPDHALTLLICYEVIYPSLVRRAVQRGARVLVNVTNDAWYGRTSGPDQFAAIAAMRSAEHGLPMIRAANTGVSAIVAAGGQVLERTPIFERRALVAPLPPARRGPTLYTRLGDWVVWASGLFLLAAGLASGGRGVVRRGRRSGDSGRAQGSG